MVAKQYLKLKLKCYCHTDRICKWSWAAQLHVKPAQYISLFCSVFGVTFGKICLEQRYKIHWNFFFPPCNICQELLRSYFMLICMSVWKKRWKYIHFSFYCSGLFLSFLIYRSWQFCGAFCRVWWSAQPSMTGLLVDCL